MNIEIFVSEGVVQIVEILSRSTSLQVIVGMIAVGVTIRLIRR